MDACLVVNELATEGKHPVDDLLKWHERFINHGASELRSDIDVVIMASPSRKFLRVILCKERILSLEVMDRG